MSMPSLGLGAFYEGTPSVGDNSMKCPACHHKNPNEAIFCMKCGKKLQRKCIHCSAELPENALFCMKCGTKLTPNGPPVDDT